MNKLSLAFLVLLAGCTSAPVEDIDYTKLYDPNEKIYYGRIIVKKHADKKIVQKKLDELEKQKKFDGMYSAIKSFIYGRFTMPEIRGSAVVGEATEYVVKPKAGKVITIYSYYSGFKLGECVKIFISENWEKYPPRIAHGFEC